MLDAPNPTFGAADPLDSFVAHFDSFEKDGVGRPSLYRDGGKRVDCGSSRRDFCATEQKSFLRNRENLPYFPWSVLRWLQSCGTQVFEEMGGHSSEDEPADVCQVSHPAGLYLRHGAGVYQLNEEPEADQERRRDERGPPENEDKEDCLNFVARIRHDERAHRCRDRSTRAQIGHG